MKDTEWLMLLEDSPQRAYSELIGEYGNYVYAIVINKLKNFLSREEIEDCVSDVFVEVFTNIDRFKSSRGSLKGFIGTIAKNTAVDTYRKLSYRRKKTAYYEDEGVELPAAADRPDNDTEDKIFRHRLWEIVKSLGEPDSSIITYQYFYDMKVHEIAAKIGMTAAAVQKRSIRARDRIKQILVKENYC